MDNLSTENLKDMSNTETSEGNTNMEPQTDPTKESSQSWVVNTKCVTHDAQEVKEWRQQRKKYEGMGMDDEIGDPPKQSKKYQFHIREVESVVEYNDEDFGEIVVINKYNGNQVPLLEDFEKIAKKHRDYNDFKDQLIANSNRTIQHTG